MMKFKDFQEASSEDSVGEMSRFVAGGSVVPVRSEPIGAERTGVRLWFVGSADGQAGGVAAGRQPLFTADA